MTSPTLLREIPIPGPVPRFEIPGWRERFGVVAGITGRGEGGGRGFDLGLWNAAPVEETMTRWRAFRRAEPGIGVTVLGHQVHQTAVSWQGADGVGERWIQLEGVDGHATSTAGILLTVTIADCIPVYLIDPVTRAVALLHSGWRGTAGGILERGVSTLVEQAGSRVENIVIHCGVGICGECYEVGSEVMDGCGLRKDGPGPWRADLRAVLAAQARALGITSLSTSQWCSAHDRGNFYSHRASGGTDGRMVAYVGMIGGGGR
jgi:YfiH family protein